MPSNPSEDFLRAEELYLRAMELPAADRERFLEQECGGDTELAAELRTLLGLGEEAQGFLEIPFDPWIGRSLGPWRVVRRLGAGGMGVVYRAERADDLYEQTVAVKLLRPGPDIEERIRFFHEERRILARLEDPRIARLIDGGTTEEGIPYLVLEYVDGVTIDQYCADHELGARPRLELFEEVCAAVHAAHRAGSIHEDLKPSNLLVTAEGDVKLLDFGIAHSIRRPGAAEIPRSARRLTPAYASPEQLSGDRITFASDVYSLGVLLVELLTGSNPRAEDFAQDDDDPVLRLPQARTLRLDANVRASASFPRVLTGDLTAIVARATRTDPLRRYASVRALADDVRRALRQEPVEARSRSRTYVAGRFVLRHRFRLAAGLVLGTTLAALAGSWWHGSLLDRKLVHAAAEHDATSRTARFYQEFASRLAGESMEQGRSVAQRNVLERMRERYDDPALERGSAEYLDWSGTQYAMLGDLDLAVRDFRRAIQCADSDPQRISQSLSARLGLAEAERRRGHVEAAATLLDEASKCLESHRELRPGWERAILYGLAVQKCSVGELHEAEALFEKAALLPELGESIEQLLCMTDQGVVLYDLHDLERSRLVLERAEELARRIAAPLVLAARVHLMLGQCALERGDRRAARQEFELARDDNAAFFGEGDPSVQLCLVLAWSAQNGTDEALDRLCEAREALVAAGSQPAARALSELAVACSSRGRLAQAVDLAADALRLYERELGPDSRAAQAVRRNRAHWLRWLGRWSAAEAEFRAALAAMDPAPADERVSAEIGLSWCLFFQNRTKEAEDAASRALESARVADSGGEREGGALLATAWIRYFGRHDADGALEVAEEALDRLRAQDEPTADLGTALHLIGWIDLEAGRIADAGPSLEEALDLHEEALGALHPLVVYDLDALSVWHLRQDEDAAAEELARRAVESARRIDGDQRHLRAISLWNLATCLSRRGADGEARAALAERAALWSTEAREGAEARACVQDLEQFDLAHPEVAGSERSRSGGT